MAKEHMDSYFESVNGQVLPGLPTRFLEFAYSSTIPMNITEVRLLIVSHFEM